MNELNRLMRKRQEQYFTGSDGDLDLQQRKEALREQEQLLDSLNKSLKRARTKEEEAQLAKVIKGVELSIEAEKTGIALFNQARETVQQPYREQSAEKKDRGNEKDATEEPKEEQSQLDIGVFDGVDTSWVKENGVDQKTFRSISSMDWEGLNSKREEGSIVPVVRRGFVTSVKLPLPNGYAQLKQDSKDAIELPSLEDYTINEDDITISVQLSTETGGPLPVPYGAKPVAGGEEGLYVQEPTDILPLVWGNQDYVEDGKAEYILSPSEGARLESYEDLIPSSKEVAYWRKVMPLPEHVRKKALENPGLTENIVGSYMREKFVYVCHDALGQFIKENADDLPLLMDELKMGHCDLLSWVQLGYLRQLGLPAFAISERVPNSDGSAFMRDYDHTRLAIVQENGELVFQDPTLVTEKPEAYTPDQLPNDLIRKLNEDYNATDTEIGKRNVLRKFLQDNPVDREIPIEEKQMNEALGFLDTSAEAQAIIESTALKREARLQKEELIFDGVDLSKPIDNDDDFLVILHNNSALYLELGAREISYIDRLKIKRVYEYLSVHGELLTHVITLGVDMTDEEEYSVVFVESDFETLGRINKSRQKSFYLYDKAGWLLLKDEIEFRNMHQNQALDSLLVIDYFGIYRETYRAGDGGRYEISPQPINNLSYELDSNYPFSDAFRQFLIDTTEGRLTLTEINVKYGRHVGEVSLDMLFFLKKMGKALGNDSEWQLLEEAFPGVDFTKFIREIVGVVGGMNDASKIESKKMLPFKYAPDVSFSEGVFYAKYSAKEHFRIFRGDPADYARARIGVNTLLQEMDFPKKRDRREPASFSTRHAVPGDDARKIDWKSSARLDIGQYVVRTPEQRPVFSNPIHVFFDVEYETYPPQAYFANIAATIETLQKDAKKRGREVYITSTTMQEYLLLSPKDDPRQIAARLVSFPKKPGSKNYQTRNGTPRNLIYLTHNEGKAKCVDFLERNNQTNVIARTFKDAGVRIMERVRDDWVEEGKDVSLQGEPSAEEV